ncbi:DUF3551 domain-containing protein [Afipia sp. P52-10]|uniref:DUF3551 domain-containing protein n=1 Tax=Afipia sp. P52-10 TaxID=1429916 RepID=UPI00136261B4|nr:DUF3551 domain-containing protein [Afipia sp. P52-10]
MISRAAAVSAVLSAAISLASAPARAEIDYPWCAITSIGQSGMPACLYATKAQCDAFIAGQAGFCQPNARYVAPPPRTVTRRDAGSAICRETGLASACHWRHDVSCLCSAAR